MQIRLLPGGPHDAKSNTSWTLKLTRRATERAGDRHASRLHSAFCQMACAEKGTGSSSGCMPVERGPATEEVGAMRWSLPANPASPPRRRHQSL